VPPACLDEKAVLAFLDGTLPDDARADVEAHLASCSACAEIVTWAAADLAHASRAPGQEGQPFVGQLAPGARVDRYQVLGPIGRGGMGEVYAAYHPDLDRRIALKIVYESSAGSAERRARLLREARTIAKLSHPNVIVVHDAGTVGERVYIAMEFVDGDTLDDWVRAAPRSWQEILDVFVATGRGLAAAHAAGIVHRDFKPQNVMIGKDGSVRVMDFGLARLVRGDLDTGAFAQETREAAASNERAPEGFRVTKTGALLGTPAYMAPEQWRGEPTDARADQFSFCVALYEALYGLRPALSHLGQDLEAANPEGAGARRPSSVPAWLRAAALRGLAADREKRFESMDQLLAALTRGRTRAQRRFTGAGIGLAVALLAFGAWRLSPTRRFDCKPPADRIAAAWSPGDPPDGRRQSIRAAILNSGHPEATSIWGELSSALDTYVGKWSAMYKETCEATHLRGEQSEEVLDLRMRCLNENLDEVRATTDVLLTADRTAVSHIQAAVSELTPVARCSDLRALRAAVTLPRDDKTFQAVQTLQSSIRDLQALYDLGRYRTALDAAIALRPKVEATRYIPLLADLLQLIGGIKVGIAEPADTEATLKESFFMATRARNDLAAAKSAANLIWVTGYREGRYEESGNWWSIANALLDRMDSGQVRVRAWAMNNEATVLVRTGEFEKARDLFQKALALKVEALGPDHPDVAGGLSNLGLALMSLGDLSEALKAQDRAARILPRNSDLLSEVLVNRGQVLFELGRYAEAEKSLTEGLQGGERGSGPSSMAVADSLTTLGEIKLAVGEPSTAVSYLERSLRVREGKESDPIPAAQARFALARALWASGGDRTRSLSLARSARQAYATNNRPRQLGTVDAWLATHTTKLRRGPARGA